MIKYINKLYMFKELNKKSIIMGVVGIILLIGISYLVYKSYKKSQKSAEQKMVPEPSRFVPPSQDCGTLYEQDHVVNDDDNEDDFGLDTEVNIPDTEDESKSEEGTGSAKPLDTMFAGGSSLSEAFRPLDVPRDKSD
jgi:hypothetical protein